MRTTVVRMLVALALGACGGGGSSSQDAAPDGTGGACLAGATVIQGDGTVSGDTSTGTDLTSSTCQVAAGGEGAKDVFYVLNSLIDGEVELTLTGDADLGLFVQSTCGDQAAELACAELALAGEAEVLTFSVTAGTSYFVGISGFSDADEGEFMLAVRSRDTGGACAAALVATEGTTTGDTTGGTTVFEGRCLGGAGAERVYTIVPGVAGESGTIEVSLTSATDQGFQIRTACRDVTTETACVDARLGGGVEVFRGPAVGGTPLTILVDAFEPGQEGPFELNVSFEPASCGDGRIEGSEQCEPPGSLNCSATCGGTDPCARAYDHDGDGKRACAEEECKLTGVCTGGTTPIGGPCTSDSTCGSSADDPVCWDELDTGCGGGYCTEFCDPVSDACPAGWACTPFDNFFLCQQTCTAADTCSTAFATCENFGGANLCSCGCDDDSDCPTTGHCNTAIRGCLITETCGNTRDDDGDKLGDCGDEDCWDDAGCPAVTEVEPNDTAATATPFAAPYVARLSPAGDVDYVGVTVGAAGVLAVAVQDVGNGDCTNGGIDTDLAVYDPDGTTVLARHENNYIRGGNYCSKIRLTGLAPGLYTVKVTVAARAEAGRPQSPTFAYSLDLDTEE